MSDLDISFALEAKSDQLNAVDIIGAEPAIKIRDVHVRRDDKQPVSIFYEGDHGKPWKPNKGMLRVLSAGWGPNAKVWIGRSVQIYVEGTVRFGGQEVGGIQIRAMSDIHKQGFTTIHAKNRQQRGPYHVKYLEVIEEEYPADQFERGFPHMVKALQEQTMTLPKIIAQCQKTGTLTAEQLARLEEAAPILNDEEEL